MPDETASPAPAAAADPAINILTGVLIGGAVLIAILGTLLPGWLGMTGSIGLVLSLAFYAVAATDVAIAFWLRARMKKAPRMTAPGGTVQRQ